MLNDTISISIECLQNEGINHSAFISNEGVEVHIWKPEQLGEAIKQLTTRYQLSINHLEAKGDTLEDLFYILKF